MLTGWYNGSDGRQYYLKGSGSMAKGWQKIGNRWRYFIPDGAEEGVMFRGNWLYYNNVYYYIDTEGMMVEGWRQIDGKYYYFYPEADSPIHEEGEMARNTVIEGFFVDQNGVWK